MSTTPNIISLSRENTVSFREKLVTLLDDYKTLDAYRSQDIQHSVTKSVSDFFQSDMLLIEAELNHEGIAVIDVPEINELDAADDALLVVGLFLGLFKEFANPNINPIDLMPFTLHEAAHSDSEKLDNAGFGEIRPDAKLGFHNDGLIKENTVSIPKYIGLVNLFIGYENPGNFYWVKSSSISLDSFAELFSEAEQKSAVVQLTPSVFKHTDGSFEKYGIDTIKTSLIGKNEYGELRLFLNGSVNADKNSESTVQFFNYLKNKIQESEEKVIVPQKERRIIFIKNTSGFHARDIFESPFPDLDLSRVFVRSMDSNVEKYIPF
ncbi:hypothetical protein NIES4101_25920 (plasmid) [Calothrix sp. NIES-4101]|nr:hypothetical protein NIES4101_25920 [Calothrix sp. NIES-4101]